MIKSFRTKTTEDIYHGLSSREARRISSSLWKVAGRKLDMINAAVQLQDLKVPPGNRLQALRGDLRGKYSIRVNNQYRIIFEFHDSDAYEVEIKDYH